VCLKRLKGKPANINYSNESTKSFPTTCGCSSGRNCANQRVSRFPLAIGRLNGGYTEKIAQHFPRYLKYNFKYTKKFKYIVLELRTFVLKIRVSTFRVQCSQYQNKMVRAEKLY